MFAELSRRSVRMTCSDTRTFSGHVRAPSLPRRSLTIFNVADFRDRGPFEAGVRAKFSSAQQIAGTGQRTLDARPPGDNHDNGSAVTRQWISGVHVHMVITVAARFRSPEGGSEPVGGQPSSVRLHLYWIASQWRFGQTHDVSSNALNNWRSAGLARLAELEAVDALVGAGGSAIGLSTTQLIRSLFVSLVAEFQGFCRDLHDAAVDVHAREANARQAALLRNLLTQGRKLNSSNPRPAALGNDFGRLGFSFIDDLKARGAPTPAHLTALDQLIDYRNVIGHGDGWGIIREESRTGIRPTITCYQQHRDDMNSWAGTMDDVVADKLATLLNVPKPW
jgi:hypothetical protein